jgi:TetR/AcrR family transcriptional regulator, lmrAB and yxaGH operons repressor
MSDSSSPRQRFLEITSKLLEQQGYHATGLNQIVAESGAPKGSLYHYFPDGKEELAADAVAMVGERLIRATVQQLERYRDPAEAARQFVLGMSKRVAERNFCGGNPVTLSALESSAQPEQMQLLAQASSQVYAELVRVFEDCLRVGGVSEPRVRALAMMIVASIEGGMILSRTLRSSEPLERIAEEVFTLIKNA